MRPVAIALMIVGVFIAAGGFAYFNSLVGFGLGDENPYNRAVREMSKSQRLHILRTGGRIIIAGVMIVLAGILLLFM